MKPFSSTWNSHKFKGPGVRYELAVAIQTGYIVWTNGPFRAGKFADLTIFRAGLKRLLMQNPGEQVEADKAYRGEPALIDVPNEMTGGSRKQRKAKDIVRTRHETCNRRFKQFNCFKQVFRHDLTLHKQCFEAVVVLTQLMIENGHPLFQVRYKTRSYPGFNRF